MQNMTKWISDNLNNLVAEFCDTNRIFDINIRNAIMASAMPQVQNWAMELIRRIPQLQSPDPQISEYQLKQAIFQMLNSVVQYIQQQQQQQAMMYPQPQQQMMGGYGGGYMGGGTSSYSAPQQPPMMGGNPYNQIHQTQPMSQPTPQQPFQPQPSFTDTPVQKQSDTDGIELGNDYTKVRTEEKKFKDSIQSKLDIEGFREFPHKRGVFCETRDLDFVNTFFTIKRPVRDHFDLLDKAYIGIESLLLDDYINVISYKQMYSLDISTQMLRTYLQSVHLNEAVEISRFIQNIKDEWIRLFKKNEDDEVTDARAQHNEIERILIKELNHLFLVSSVFNDGRPTNLINRNLKVLKTLLSEDEDAILTSSYNDSHKAFLMRMRAAYNFTHYFAAKAIYSVFNSLYSDKQTLNPANDYSDFVRAPGMSWIYSDNSLSYDHLSKETAPQDPHTYTKNRSVLLLNKKLIHVTRDVAEDLWSVKLGQYQFKDRIETAMDDLISKQGIYHHIVVEDEIHPRVYVGGMTLDGYLGYFRTQ
jgi:hypothetical protein